MLCPSCGNENPEGVRFCIQCGAQMPVTTIQPKETPRRNQSPPLSSSGLFPIYRYFRVILIVVLLAGPLGGFLYWWGKYGRFQVALRNADTIDDPIERTIAKCKVVMDLFKAGAHNQAEQSLSKIIQEVQKFDSIPEKFISLCHCIKTAYLINNKKLAYNLLGELMNSIEHIEDIKDKIHIRCQVVNLLLPLLGYVYCRYLLSKCLKETEQIPDAAQMVDTLCEIAEGYLALNDIRTSQRLVKQAESVPKNKLKTFFDYYIVDTAVSTAKLSIITYEAKIKQSVPIIIFPINGINTNLTPILKMQVKEEIGFIRYEVQMRKESEIRIFLTDINWSGVETSYTIPSNKALSPGKWVWKARIIWLDGTKGPWSEEQTFVAKP